MVENEINSINAGRYVPVFVNNIPSSALVDSGNSAGCCISLAFARRIGLSDLDLDETRAAIGTARQGTTLTCLGKTKKPLAMTFAGTTFMYKFRPYVIKELSSNINLSLDFLEENSIDQIHSSKSLRVKGKMIRMHGLKAAFGVQQVHQEELQELNAYIAQDTVVPAMSAKLVPIRIPKLEQIMWFGGSGVLTPEMNLTEKYDLLPAKNAIVLVNSSAKTRTAILNNSGNDVLIPKNAKFGTFEVAQVDKDPRPNKTLDWPTEKVIQEFELDKSEFLKDNPERMAKAITLLRQFGDMISDDPDHYGNTSLVRHTIDTGEAKPIRHKLRPLNKKLEEDLLAQINKWLEKDVIEESASPWSSRLVPVPKKNKKIRFCVDYRDLNKVTKKDAFPLPNIEESLTRMSDCKIFSALDGTGAYHSVHIDEKDREKTAFTCHLGTFQFKRMPFGLCNAPATFSRLIMKALTGLDKKYYAPFLDDVAIFSKSFDDHIEHLFNVLNAQRKAGMTLNPRKCQFFRAKIDFLGHTISKDGIETNKAYVEVVQKWPIPKNIAELRTFLGKTGYYRKFIKGYSTVACPLLNMINKDTTKSKTTRVSLNEKQLAAFNMLKELLLKAPILSFADFDSSEPFILDTNWSKDPGAIGGVLSQVQGGKERVICYGARKLTPAERDYSSNKGELLAILHFVRLWKFFLWPRKFIIRTDNNALQWIYSMDHPQSMMMRWLETLALYNFKVVHKNGTQHGNADSLSRTTHINTEGAIIAELNATLPIQTDIKENDIIDYDTHLSNDPTLREVKNWVLNKSTPPRAELKGKGRELHAYHIIANLLSLHQGRIYVKWKRFDGTEFDRLCLPKGLQKEAVLKCHGEAHQGTAKTIKMLQQRFFFPCLQQLTQHLIANCLVCQSVQGPNKPQKHTLVPTHSEYPWDKVSIDLVGPLKPSSKGNTHILTARCCFTRWIEGIPIKDTSAESVAKELFTHVISRFGMPSQLHSDKGRQFDSDLFKKFCELLGISKTATPAYNPKSNMVERAHRDIKAGIRCMDHLQGDWEDHLPTVLMGLRTSVCRTTGVTPYMAMFGREAQLPLDIIYGKPINHDESVDSGIIRSLRDRLETIYDHMRTNQRQAVERQSKQYDMPIRKFEVGDKVWLFTPTIKKTKGSKLTIFWTGPWIVIEKISDVVYAVKTLGDWNKKQIAVTAGIDRLKQFRGELPKREEQLELTPKDIMPNDIFADNVEYREGQERQLQSRQEQPRHQQQYPNRAIPLPRPNKTTQLLRKSQTMMDKLIRIGERQSRRTVERPSQMQSNCMSYSSSITPICSWGSNETRSHPDSQEEAANDDVIDVQEDIINGGNHEPTSHSTEPALEQEQAHPHAEPELTNQQAQHHAEPEITNQEAQSGEMDVVAQESEDYQQQQPLQQIKQDVPPPLPPKRGRRRRRTISSGQRSASWTPPRAHRVIARPTSLQRHRMITRSKSREKRLREKTFIEEQWQKMRQAMNNQTWKRRKEVEVDDNAKEVNDQIRTGIEKVKEETKHKQFRPHERRVPEMLSPSERRTLARDERAEQVRSARARECTRRRSDSISSREPRLRSSTPTREVQERLEQLNESLSTISNRSRLSQRDRQTSTDSEQGESDQTMRTARQTPSNSVRMDDKVTVHHYASHISMDDEPMPFVPCQACLPPTDGQRAAELASRMPSMTMAEAMKIVSAQEARERAQQLEKELRDEHDHQDALEPRAVAHFDWRNYRISVGTNTSKKTANKHQ